MQDFKRALYLLRYDCKVTRFENESSFLLEQKKEGDNLFSLVNTKEPIDKTYVSKKPITTKSKFYNGFLLPINLLNTKKPEPPKIRTYFKQSGTSVSKEPMEYTRYEGENKYKTYYFDSDDRKVYDDLYKVDLERWNNENSFWEKYKHDILDIAAIGSLFLPYGPIISILFDLGNIGLFVSEGDEFNAGLRAMFLMIPFGTLARRFKPIREMGEEAFKKFVWEKLSRKKGGSFSNKEMEAIKELAKGKKWIENQVTYRIIKKTIKLIFKKKTTLRGIVNYIWLLTKKYPKTSFLLNLGVTIGGISYTWGELAKIFGISQKTSYKDKIIEIETEWKKIKNEKEDQLSEEMAEVLLKTLPDYEELTKIFLESFQNEN